MESIKVRLQKLKSDAKERSKYLSHSGDLDKTHSSTATIQNSYTSEETKSIQVIGCNNKNNRSEGCFGQHSKSTLPAVVHGTPMKSWKSESEMPAPAARFPSASLSVIKEGPNQKHREPSPPTASRSNLENNKKIRTSSREEPLREKRLKDRGRTGTGSVKAAHQQQENNSSTSINVNDKQYTILSVIGKGGTSVVYQAFSEWHKCIVAIKCVNLSNVDVAVREAYENEIKLLAQLQESPYVIRMYDCEKRRNNLLVVMECGDIDLATFMHKKADEIDGMFIKYHFHEMVKCVQVIHDKNIVHSDLKPANFLFVGASLKLIDFGIASNIPSNKTSVVKDIQVGTLNYMSPETINGSYVGANGEMVYKIPLKSDVWSLGCILYAMVCRRTPFQHITNQMAKINAISSETHQIEFPKLKDRLLLDVLKKCLVRDVRKRASIEQLLAHPYLNDVLLGTPSPARPIPISQMANKKGSTKEGEDRNGHQLETIFDE